MIKGLVEDLKFPLPAIAVTPDEGPQIWISLSTPVELAKAERLISSLHVQFLDEIPDDECVVRPSLTEPTRNEVQLAPIEFPEGKWSAFIDPTILSMFKEETWLGMPPNLDKQGKLLAQVEFLDPENLWSSLPSPGGYVAEKHHQKNTEPMEFLLSVMRDRAQGMSIRIEAAKALLPFFHKPAQ
jgi:hypothetical protein